MSANTDKNSENYSNFGGRTTGEFGGDSSVKNSEFCKSKWLSIAQNTFGRKLGSAISGLFSRKAQPTRSKEVEIAAGRIAQNNHPKRNKMRFFS